MDIKLNNERRFTNVKQRSWWHEQPSADIRCSPVTESVGVSVTWWQHDQSWLQCCRAALGTIHVYDPTLQQNYNREKQRINAGSITRTKYCAMPRWKYVCHAITSSQFSDGESKNNHNSGTRDGINWAANVGTLFRMKYTMVTPQNRKTHATINHCTCTFFTIFQYNSVHMSMLFQASFKKSM